MRELGLRPLGDDGTYLQSFLMHGAIPLPESRLFLHRPGRTLEWEFERDFLLYATGAGSLVPRPTRMVFAGYGIVAPEFDHDDYRGVDVEGALVVVISGEPASTDPEYFHGESETRYSLPSFKQQTAMARGARDV